MCSRFFGQPALTGSAVSLLTPCELAIARLWLLNYEPLSKKTSFRIVAAVAAKCSLPYVLDLLLPASRRNSVTSESSEVKTNSDKQIILVVDDMPANIQVAHNILKDTYIIKIATSGARALDLAKVLPQPDLILLDVMMPEMDGYEVCSRLKSDPSTSRHSHHFPHRKDRRRG